MLRALALSAAVLLLAGCVWSRLLDWKGQLKEFDRYMEAVDDGPALVLRFKQPCIRASDIGYLLGGDQPTRREARAGGGIWTSWLLRRNRPDSIGLDIALGSPDAGADTLADSLRVPPQVTAFLPKDRLLGMARAFGSADIDRSKREASAGVDPGTAKPPTPGRAVVVAALGEPDSAETRDGRELLTYRFQLVQADGSLGPATVLFLELRGETLLSARMQAPNFNAEMRFAQ